jgi:hypothetical protein
VRGSPSGLQALLVNPKLIASGNIEVPTISIDIMEQTTIVVDTFYFQASGYDLIDSNVFPKVMTEPHASPMQVVPWYNIEASYNANLLCLGIAKHIRIYKITSRRTIVK